MPSKSKVYFFFDNVTLSLRDRSRLKQQIEGIFSHEKKELESLTYVFCSDKRLLKMNRDFLSHDYYTDIITFDLSTTDAVAGEIYISVDRVKDNARKIRGSIKSELHRVMFHGALHLCGYNDKTKADQKAMREREDFYLRRTLAR